MHLKSVIQTVSAICLLYIGTECSKTPTLCSTCTRGFFCNEGNSCRQCPDRCTTCNSTNFCYACKNGYKGNACEDDCSNCKPGSKCDKRSGFCTGGCKDGVFGSHCNIMCDSKCTACHRHIPSRCSKCAPNRHGISCNEHCSSTCFKNVCNDTDGVCTHGCLAGYWGPKCEKSCSTYCKKHVCDFQDGACSEGCMDGYFAENCSTGICDGCDKGYCSVGEPCQQCPINCSSCLSASFCNSCKTGFFGESCSFSCPYHCSKRKCYKASGECLSCENEYKGKFCEEECSGCKPDTSCDKNSGYCFENCTDGLSGERCNIKCDSKCISCERQYPHQCILYAHGNNSVSCNETGPKTCNNQNSSNNDGVGPDMCSTGDWRHTCNKTCSTYCKDKICKIDDGECLEDTVKPVFKDHSEATTKVVFKGTRSLFTEVFFTPGSNSTTIETRFVTKIVGPVIGVIFISFILGFVFIMRRNIIKQHERGGMRNAQNYDGGYFNENEIQAAVHTDQYEDSLQTNQYEMPVRTELLEHSPQRNIYEESTQRNIYHNSV